MHIFSIGITIYVCTMWVAHLICRLKWMTCAAGSHWKYPHYSHSCKQTRFASVQMTGQPSDPSPLTMCTQNTLHDFTTELMIASLDKPINFQPGQQPLGRSQTQENWGSSYSFSAYGNKNWKLGNFLIPLFNSLDLAETEWEISMHQQKAGCRANLNITHWSGLHLKHRLTALSHTGL